MENESEQQANVGGNFVVIETHLQVSNLIKILLTIPYDVLKLSVENIPEEVTNTQHAKILRSVLEFYTNVISLSQPAQTTFEVVREEEEAAQQEVVAVEEAAPAQDAEAAPVEEVKGE